MILRKSCNCSYTLEYYATLVRAKIDGQNFKWAQSYASNRSRKSKFIIQIIIYNLNRKEKYMLASPQLNSPQEMENRIINFSQNMRK